MDFLTIPQLISNIKTDTNGCALKSCVASLFSNPYRKVFGFVFIPIEFVPLTALCFIPQ